jgi:hypothetical protein
LVYLLLNTEFLLFRREIKLPFVLFRLKEAWILGIMLHRIPHWRSLCYLALFYSMRSPDVLIDALREVGHLAEIALLGRERLGIDEVRLHFQPLTLIHFGPSKSHQLHLGVLVHFCWSFGLPEVA